MLPISRQHFRYGTFFFEDTGLSKCRICRGLETENCHVVQRQSFAPLFYKAISKAGHQEGHPFTNTYFMELDTVPGIMQMLSRKKSTSQAMSCIGYGNRYFFGSIKSLQSTIPSPSLPQGTLVIQMKLYL